MAEPITIDQQIECAERELKLRLRVYPNRVMNGKMTAQLMARETTRMEAVISTLKAVKGLMSAVTTMQNDPCKGLNMGLHEQSCDDALEALNVTAPLVPPGGLF